jgi:hypothetical protein
MIRALGRKGQNTLVALLVPCLVPALAAALVSLDFETPYLVHPGQQVWDFCLVQHEGRYHAFYHTIPPEIQHPAAADTIWHAVSDDLRRWTLEGPALTSGPEWWDGQAVWAPDVVFDAASSRWAMLYTGVGQGMVQRACLAWSVDLVNWTKSPANPVFEPDSVIYYWAPSQNWSSFRDPFLYHDGQQWNMLSTAHLRLGGEPASRRAIVHRSVSPDLTDWQDQGVFFAHDGIVGQTHDFESVQYLVRDGWHHLFFTEQDPGIEHHPTSHLMATDPAAWTMADRAFVDAGWAPEIKPFLSPSEAEIFARLAKDQNPVDGTWFVTARFDSIRFGPGGQPPRISYADPLGEDWLHRSGEVGAAAPTFGDNPTWRGAPAVGAQGHGWFGSVENYGGPLSGVGWPGALLGEMATGRLESRPFDFVGGFFRLLLAGGWHPATCYVGLVDDGTDEVLTTIHPNGESSLVQRLWDVRDFSGRRIRLVIVDEESGPGGWIAVDAIEEVEETSGVRDLDRENAREIPFLPVTNLVAYPNPFNSSTYLGCEVERAGSVSMEIFDLAGRIVWRSAPLETPAGEFRVHWDGRDIEGRGLPSGNYFCRVIHDGMATGGMRLNLVK